MLGVDTRAGSVNDHLAVDISEVGRKQCVSSGRVMLSEHESAIASHFTLSTTTTSFIPGSLLLSSLTTSPLSLEPLGPHCVPCYSTCAPVRTIPWPLLRQQPPHGHARSRPAFLADRTKSPAQNRKDGGRYRHLRGDDGARGRLGDVVAHHPGSNVRGCAKVEGRRLMTQWTA